MIFANACCLTEISEEGGGEGGGEGRASSVNI